MSTTNSDPTFRSYSAQQAKTYATHRVGYDPAIYNTVFDYHVKTDGHFGLLLDCGCGPGNATRDMAVSFDHVIGVDAGAAMINEAREIGGKTKSGENIKFEVSPAESFSQTEGLEPGSVHWFDMNEFWAEAAKVVKPGGTVALWTRASLFPHPDTPNYHKVRETMLHFENEVLGPYQVAGNRISRGMYDTLPLPWNVSPPVKDFPESKYVRHEYDRDGVLSNGKTFFSGAKVNALEEIEGGLATASLVTRWRAAHPDLVGTDKDCVKTFIREMRKIMVGKHELLIGSATVILLFKKLT
ncbi:hypothetical protein G7Y89_g15066 [Cudoniella acicularis]|uniref:Methyltransferase domain-containing protein n=1 Tax=Cudoniella acicularis TaxID=354080 RepID=A0A8H4VP30_9HELO|nr:hypothetical protein G7Y89_g15066 [Cudoniella acicularis]